MALNEMESHMKPPKTLCPTDSRNRPDIRKLEEGEIDEAIAEKNRLEEKQRDARKARKAKKGGDDWKPRYKKDDITFAVCSKNLSFCFLGGSSWKQIR
jgi:oxysterol-binding protein-related protein 1/2